MNFFNILPRGLRTYYMSLWTINMMKIFSRIPVFLLFLFFSPTPALDFKGISSTWGFYYLAKYDTVKSPN
jgi:hypothetical protein